MSQDVSGDRLEQATTRWRVIGPGLVAAATGVGAADLIATLIAGSKFGYLLAWLSTHCSPNYRLPCGA